VTRPVRIARKSFMRCLIPWRRQFQKADPDETSDQIGAAIAWRDNPNGRFMASAGADFGTSLKYAAFWGNYLSNCEKLEL
jgi:hypothetical protein